mmetsp:Transcript_32374/g.49524  ORF Transcript_32374/g.49524 Transcript_32374/m.49524 type:complete len:134 (-) Transcript_32374:631-1032(-)
MIDHHHLYHHHNNNHNNHNNNNNLNNNHINNNYNIKINDHNNNYNDDDYKMWKEIRIAFQTLGTLGDGCRCVLLKGKGQSFCAGIDFTDESLLLSNDEEDVARKGMAFFSKDSRVTGLFDSRRRMSLARCSCN